MRYQEDNCLQYGWGDKLYGKRETADKMWVKFKKCTQKPMSWREECIRAADMIYQSTDKNILVHFSGGIDSEIICRSFLENGHPFKAMIFRFENNLNLHDIAYAVKFCKEYNIEYSIVDFSILDFLKTTYHNIELPNPVSNDWFQLWHTYLHKFWFNMGYGYQIMGEGQLFLIHDTLNVKKVFYEESYHFPSCTIRTDTWPKDRRLDDDIYLLFYEINIDPVVYMDEYKIDGCYLFQMYTSEMVYSYLNDPLVLDWLTYCQLPGDELSEDRLYPLGLESVTKEEYRKRGHAHGGNSALNSKIKIKCREWPELELRPKYTGMENVNKKMLVELFDKVSKEHPLDSPGNNVAVIKYDQLIRDLEVSV